MGDSFFQRFVSTGSSPADGASTTALNLGIEIAPLYLPGQTLVRSRLFLELRVVTYSTDSASRSLDVNWWVNTFPVAGIFWDGGGLGHGATPINAVSEDQFVLLDAMSGAVEFEGLDEFGNEILTYLYRFPAGTLDSHGQRKSNPDAYQGTYLCWDFVDPGDLINRSHESFPQAYDLGATWNVTTYWKYPRT